MSDGAPHTEAAGRKRQLFGGEKVGLTVSGAALFLLLRMFAISEWNWHTALDVLGAMDFGNVVPIALGTIVAQPVVTATVVVILLPVAVVELFWPSEANSRSVLWLSALIAALLVVFIASAKTFGDWWLVPVMVALVAVIVAMRLLWRRGTGRQRMLRALRSIGLVAAAAFLLMAAVVPTPWVPRELITTRAHGVIDGYVLSVEPGFLQVLTASDREVVTLTTSDVVQRETVR